MPDAWILVIAVLAGAAIGLLFGYFLFAPRTDPKLDALRKRDEIEPARPALNDRTAHAAAVLEATDLLKRGKKIEAIKVYRERTGVGLAEAKAAVERL